MATWVQADQIKELNPPLHTSSVDEDDTIIRRQPLPFITSALLTTERKDIILHTYI